MPAQQQGSTCLHDQLPETAFLNEHDQGVERQHHREQVDRSLGGDHVAVVQRMERREAEEGRRQGDCGAGGQPEKGQVHRHDRRGEERQHQYSGGMYLRRQVVGKERDGGLDEQGTADGKTVVPSVGVLSFPVQDLVTEPEEIVFGRPVRGDRQVVRRDRVVPP